MSKYEYEILTKFYTRKFLNATDEDKNAEKTFLHNTFKLKCVINNNRRHAFPRRVTNKKPKNRSDFQRSVQY